MRRMLLCALGAMLLWIQTGRAQDPTASRLVHLRSETIDTTQRINLLDTDHQPPRFDRKRYVVQLDGAITPQRRQQLVAAGVAIEDYLPDHAYIVDLNRVDPAALSRIDFVAWAGAFESGWKIDPAIGRRLKPFETAQRNAIANRGDLQLVVTLFDADELKTVTDEMARMGATVSGDNVVGAQAEVYVTASKAMLEAIAAIDAVQFVEEAPEITFRNNTTRWIVQSNINNVTPLYANGLTGSGQIVGVLDGRADQDHCSLDGGKILFYNTTDGNDFHGTHVSGTAVGDNGVNDNTRGVAYDANMVFNITPSFTEAGILQRLNLHHSQGARIHTNSWGDDGTTSYNSLARGFDLFLHDNEDDIVCLAATNTANLRNPENAKNLLAVGASQDSPNQGNFCSGGTGPTADGRRKPEIFAPGCNTQSAQAGTACSVAGATGTSMATPAVAGVAALVRQYFVDGYYPSGSANAPDSMIPSGALIKAALLNSAVDMTGIGGYPSNGEGWGRLLADNSLFFFGDARKLVLLDDIRNANGLSTNDELEYLLDVISSSEQLRVTMVFTDAPASASTGTGNAAVNDLDLEVISPTGATFRGNVFSGGQSTTGGTADAINNVEQVHVTSPMVGSWTVRVRGAAVNQGPQGFALIATGDASGMLPALSINALDPIPTLLAPGNTFDFDVQIIEGTQTLSPGSPTLHYRFDGGAFQTAPLAAQGGEIYTANLPVSNCGDSPEFYVSAAGDGGALVTDPPGAPGSVFSFEVGSLIVTFSDDAQADLGWTVSSTATDGQWDRGVPVNNNRGDPAADFDGSGQCFLTDNDPANSNSDVDGGTTTLTSPVLDMSAGGQLSYAYWLNDVANGALSPEDVMDVEVATDAAGTNWTTLRTYGTALGAWRTDSIDIDAEVGASSTLRIRFTVGDLGAANVVEAGIDAVVASHVECVPAGDGDFDNDGDLDLFDFGGWQTCFGVSPVSVSCEPADMVADGVIDDADFAAFEALLTGP